MCIRDRLNVLLVLIISSMVGGIAAGMPIDQTMTIFMNGMAGNSETALSYILLGAIAVGIAKTGLMSILSDGMQRVFEMCIRDSDMSVHGGLV